MSRTEAGLIALGLMLVALVIGGIVLAVYNNSAADRQLTRQCINSGKSPVECRVAVRGTR